MADDGRCAAAAEAQEVPESHRVMCWLRTSHYEVVMFKVNEGTADRAVRVIVGIALVALALTKGWTWAWIGVLPIITGAVGFCPLYTLLGINTCGAKKA
jgi:hypothetical protein